LRLSLLFTGWSLRAARIAMLGVILAGSGVFGFVLTVVARRPEPEPPFEFQSVGRSSFQIDVDELRS